MNCRGNILIYFYISIDNGILLPNLQTLGIFIYGCHLNPDYFPEPTKFKPERFMNDKILPYSYIPFSCGERNCIGKYFKFTLFIISG